MGYRKSHGEALDEAQIRLASALRLQQEVERIGRIAREQIELARRGIIDDLGLDMGEESFTVAKKWADRWIEAPRVDLLVRSIMMGGDGAELVDEEPPAELEQPVPAAAAPPMPHAQTVVQVAPAPRTIPSGEATVDMLGIKVPADKISIAQEILDDADRIAREGGPIDKYNNAWGINRWRRNLFLAAHTEACARYTKDPSSAAGIDQPSLPWEGAPAAAAEAVRTETRIEPEAYQPPPVEEAPLHDDVVFGESDERDYGPDVDDHMNEPGFTIAPEEPDLPDFLTSGAPPPHDNWEDPYRTGVAASETVYAAAAVIPPPDRRERPSVNGHVVHPPNPAMKAAMGNRPIRPVGGR